MKTYLITMLVVFVISAVSTDKTPPSDGVKAIAYCLRLVMLFWTINLLVQL